MTRDAASRAPLTGFPNIVAKLTPEERRRLTATLVESELRAVDHDWIESWAHDGQREPPGDWQTWVIMAGRGFGKTRSGAEWIAAAARADGDLRIALVAATFDEARRIMIEGESGLLNVAADEIRTWAPSRRLLVFTSGAQAELFSGASPEQLRGFQHHIAWCDELAKWEKAKDSWDMLQLGLRLSSPSLPRPRVLVTTTPRTGTVLDRIRKSSGTVETRGGTRGNPHLPQAYVETVERLYAGTRLGRQELEGEMLARAGALWTEELIERCRLIPLPFEGEGAEQSEAGEGMTTCVPATTTDPHPSAASLLPPSPSKGRRNYVRTLIAVDPPSGEGTCGIIACARDRAGHVHVLADHSVTDRSPEGWASAVSASAAAHGTREVIAESNQGGRMVKSILLTADAGLHVRLVTATHGKSDRAEPVAHLFEAGRAWFAGRFPALEAQLTGLIAGGGYEGPGTSPDRADAMVWGLSTLAKEWGEVRVRVV